MEYYFEECIVIGSGQFAFNCARYLQQIYRLDGIYEYGSYIQSRLEILCKKNSLPYIKLFDKADCNRLMNDIVKRKKRTLIISASNIYIFPVFVTECADVKVINYHPALLSGHLGRNTEAWAIYEQDEVTGVTWHEVTSEIDHGLILAEETIGLDRSITAVKLMMKQYQVGYELFKQFIGRIVENKEIQKKAVANYGSMHYSYEKPNNGMLDLSWDGEKISAFLRSMDYGSLGIMGRPFVIKENVKYYWDTYIIMDDLPEQYENNDMVIHRNNTVCVLKNIHLEDNA